ncbi:hypothetical protein [Litoribacterium kuwaitense]|uniref:hypothetical protein n=1 Tax=Litoribacterium kuwaitense TaxID=1398745 RepID=UPI001FEBBF88|nr:hypothetical protein [Litoribacterium kuwaitense]
MFIHVMLTIFCMHWMDMRYDMTNVLIFNHLSCRVNNRLHHDWLRSCRHHLLWHWRLRGQLCLRRLTVMRRMWATMFMHELYSFLSSLASTL